MNTQEGEEGVPSIQSTSGAVWRQDDRPDDRPVCCLYMVHPEIIKPVCKQLNTRPRGRLNKGLISNETKWCLLRTGSVKGSFHVASPIPHSGPARTEIPSHRAGEVGF